MIISRCHLAWTLWLFPDVDLVERWEISRLRVTFLFIKCSLLWLSSFTRWGLTLDVCLWLFWHKTHLLHAHIRGSGKAERKHKLTQNDNSTNSFYLCILIQVILKHLPADISAAQILTQRFPHLTVKWVCLSPAVPYSLSGLPVCLYETEERQTMLPSCPSAWQCGKAEQRVCSVAHLKSEAAARPHAALCPGQRVLGGLLKSGSEGGDFLSSLCGSPPLVARLFWVALWHNLSFTSCVL